MENNSLLTLWHAHLAAGGASSGTIELRLSHIRRALRAIKKPLDEITEADLVAYLGHSQWAPATRRSIRASLRTFWAWAVARGHLPTDIAADLPRVAVPRAVPRPAGDSDIWHAITTAPPRVQLMLELMAYGGLRRCEVARVHVRDLSGTWLTVHGKGGHERLVPLPGHVCARIRQAEGYVFPGNMQGHLSPAYVGKLVSRALPAGVTPHMLRHRYATTVYSRSHDIRAVQQLLGHAKLDTTMIYTAVASETLAAAGSEAWQLSA